MNKEYYTLVVDEYGPSIEEKDQALQEISDELVQLENKLDYLMDFVIQNLDRSTVNILKDDF